MSNTLDPDQDRYFVSPGLGANCLQRLAADDKMSIHHMFCWKLSFTSQSTIFQPCRDVSWVEPVLGSLLKDTTQCATGEAQTSDPSIIRCIINAYLAIIYS